MGFRVACIAIVTAALVAGADQVQIPDASTGHINGSVAIMFWPANSTSGGKIDRLLPAEGCRVILSPWSDFTAERSYRCGGWFQPPDGRYQAWLENGSDRISSVAATVNYGATPFEGIGQQIVMPFEFGGRIA